MLAGPRRYASAASAPPPQYPITIGIERGVLAGCTVVTIGIEGVSVPLLTGESRSCVCDVADGGDDVGAESADIGGVDEWFVGQNTALGWCCRLVSCTTTVCDVVSVIADLVGRITVGSVGGVMCDGGRCRGELRIDTDCSMSTDECSGDVLHAVRLGTLDVVTDVTSVCTRVDQVEDAGVPSTAWEDDAREPVAFGGEPDNATSTEVAEWQLREATDGDIHGSADTADATLLARREKRQGDVFHGSGHSGNVTRSTRKGAAGDGQCEVEEGLHDGVAGRRKGRSRPRRDQLTGVCECWGANVRDEAADLCTD